jgi:hypothetical protein
MSNVLKSKNNNAPLRIIFTNSEPAETNDNEVWVNNIDELKKIMYFMNNEVEVIFDEYMQKNHHDIYSQFLSGNINEINNDLVWDYRDPQVAIDVIKKIPLSTYTVNCLESNPSRIEKKYVHKKDGKNVFISLAEKQGNMFCFLGFPDIAEIQIDHDSDHFDGIKIFEVSRQASIASMILDGFPFDAINILTKNTIHYKKFIEKKQPYFIQTLPMVQTNGGYLYCAFAIIQNKKLCAYGYFAGIGYTTKDEYLKARRGGSYSK